MKILKCDQCGSDGGDVKTYTYAKICLHVKCDYPFEIVGDGITYNPHPQKEFCDNCAGIIQESYKHFLEENVP